MGGQDKVTDILVAATPASPSPRSSSGSSRCCRRAPRRSPVTIHRGQSQSIEEDFLGSSRRCSSSSPGSHCSSRSSASTTRSRSPSPSGSRRVGAVAGHGIVEESDPGVGPPRGARRRDRRLGHRSGGRHRAGARPQGAPRTRRPGIGAERRPCSTPARSCSRSSSVPASRWPRSVLPAVRASRVPPLAALRDVAIDRSDTSLVRAILGAIFTAGGIGLLMAAIFGSGEVLLGRRGRPQPAHRRHRPRPHRRPTDECGARLAAAPAPGRNR